MMKISDFLAQLNKAASSSSLYVMGGFGAPAGYGTNRKRYSTNNSYNRQLVRSKKILNASDNTYFWDCVGLIKGILWGWIGNPKRVYGGADYGSNGVPDYDAKQMMFSGCKDASPIKGRPEPGEFLWFDGHCGVYMGDGKTIESTPSGSDGVQIRTFDSRWKYHGHLKYVDYTGVKPVPTPSGDYKIGEIYKVTCKGPLRIRTGPDTDHAIIDNLFKDDHVCCEEVIKDVSSGNIWLKISGYVAAKYDGEEWIE